jgi:hypothetical protein
MSFGGKIGKGEEKRGEIQDKKEERGKKKEKGRSKKVK